MLKFVVYVLKSQKDGRYYIGQTNQFERRLQEHNNGKTSSLKNRLPVILVYSEQWASRSEAVRRERCLKSLKGGKTFKQILEF